MASDKKAEIVDVLELRVWRAYPVFWAILITIGISMFFYFRKKGWL